MGCKQNISLFMKAIDIENEQIPIDNCFSLEWGNAFPINYFDYKNRNTIIVLHLYGKDEKDFSIKKVTIKIQQWKYKYEFIEFENMTIERNDDLYYITLKDCMSDILTSENDLLKFQDINKIEVIITIDTKDVEEKMNFSFTPIIKKSFSIIDNLMSI